jgi:hypothetical protein
MTRGVRERWHGTPGGVSNHGCKCADCRAANASYQRDLRARLYDGPCPTPGCPRRISKGEGTGLCRPCSRARRESQS